MENEGISLQALQERLDRLLQVNLDKPEEALPVVGKLSNEQLQSILREIDADIHTLVERDRQEKRFQYYALAGLFTLLGLVCYKLYKQPSMTDFKNLQDQIAAGAATTVDKSPWAEVYRPALGTIFGFIASNLFILPLL